MEAGFSAADVAYVNAEYRTLDSLCSERPLEPNGVRAQIASGRLPRPTYVLPGGAEMFPPDYLALVDDAGDVDALPAHFRTRYLAASAASPTSEADAEEDWHGYLSGQFGVCLWSVTPESMAAKNRLTRAIDGLLAAPAPADPSWCAELRAAVDQLDALERPFTDFDRQRWGDTGRDRYITRVRAQYLGIVTGPR